jgi:hypothetical protein
MASLAYALERYQWFGLSEVFFAHTLRFPESIDARVRWHEQALTGLARVRAKRAMYKPEPNKPEPSTRHKPEP